MEKKKRKKILKGLKIFSLIVLAIALILIGIVGFKILKLRNEAIELVKEGGKNAFRSSLTSVIYDNSGEKIANLSNNKESYYLEYNKIPYLVKQTFLTIEDRKFYDHNGIDYKAVVRALFELLKNNGEITQGGSTITQQLARNVYLSHEVTLRRKLMEVFISWEIEDEYSKEDILEFYINDIYFGNGMYGIASAAKGYFNKEVKDLTVSETAYLCGIPNSPTRYNPFTNNEEVLSRRDRVLDQLLKYNIINMIDYNNAITEKISINPGNLVKNNYVETFVRYSATRELMKLKGFTFSYKFDSEKEKTDYKAAYNEMYEECNKELFTKGYKIYTSIDMKMQQKLQDTIDFRMADNQKVNEEGVYKLQAAAVCIDNQTGFVVSISGGREQGFEGYTLNRAFQSFRQPGSSIKPILVYTPLFERGYTPNSVERDEKIENGPVNSPNTYSGDISLRTAIVYSKNTIAWKLLEKMGIKNGIDYLLNMGFVKIDKKDYIPAIAIGGMTYGVSPLEMASAYSAIANEGIYNEPTCIYKIEDSYGNIILDNSKREGKRVYEKNATLTMSDVLKDVIGYGTGSSYKLSNAIAAGKTGTTNDNKDVWFVGYTKYYTTSVWTGYDMPESIEGEYIKNSGYVWKEYMEKIHQELDKVDFIKPTTEDKKTDKTETTSVVETFPEEVTTVSETEATTIKETDVVTESSTEEALETTEEITILETTTIQDNTETTENIETGSYIP